jgi:hypothetical protein
MTSRTHQAGGKLLPHGSALWKGPSPRPISTGWLSALLRVHLRPIKQVVFLRPYPVNPVRGLVLEGASRLDAFSAYPGPTWLPSICLWRDNWNTLGRSTAVFSYWRQLSSDLLHPRRIGTELSYDVLNPARVPL